jgi:hypothetical protein
LLTKAAAFTDRRNRVIHDICYQNKDGILLLKDDNSPAVSYPSNAELSRLLSDIRAQGERNRRGR